MLIGGMPDHHREFLIGFERGEPDWSLLKIGMLQSFPPFAGGSAISTSSSPNSVQPWSNCCNLPLHGAHKNSCFPA
ncbi:hypothetical protein [Agrobacterium salinitolerans]|uniref:hypothetical protein n=1 Tax=Agrobacterium salinitolerans TaxID=1183413 RepID=UPI0022B8399E|nr:hypothetical protein [Agrobacterium salinitolerans]MCZ7889460.1 hypothetical protein [Agrobacterium salinitolerans]